MSDLKWLTDDLFLILSFAVFEWTLRKADRRIVPKIIIFSHANTCWRIAFFLEIVLKTVLPITTKKIFYFYSRYWTRNERYYYVYMFVMSSFHGISVNSMLRHYMQMRPLLKQRCGTNSRAICMKVFLQCQRSPNCLTQIYIFVSRL